MFKECLIIFLIIFIFPVQLLASDLEYDANGNLIYDGTWNYTYDYKDQLVQVANGISTTTYGYDFQGNRVKKTVDGVTTITPNKYYSVTGATTTKSIFNPQTGELIATIVSNGNGTSTNYVHTDHLGGTNVVTDENSNVKQTLDYYPFGETRVNEQTGSDATKRKFTGHEFDSETGLYFMGARYYNPAIGRFISHDPEVRDVAKMDKEKLNEFLSNPQNLNSYSYARNNPINNVDPTGKSTVSAWILHPIQTLKQAVFWKDVSVGSHLINRPLTGILLSRSVNLYPSDVLITADNQKDYGNAIDQIKNSSEYKKAVDRAIANANNGVFETKGSLTFKDNGDLSTSLHKSDYVIKVQNNNGSWGINSTFQDKYDYDYSKTTQSVSPSEVYNNGMKQLNNAAYSSQQKNVISNYNIKIKFNDQRKK